MAISVGFIGLGNMGNPMAMNVLKNGFPMTVFDKNPNDDGEPRRRPARKARSRRRRWSRASEVVLTSPARLARGRSALSRRQRAHRAREAGQRLVDLSSVLPSTPRKLEARCQGARRRISSKRR